MERLHQHLARADRELRDAQHFLAPDSAEEAERNIVRAVTVARIAVTTALERVRSRLGIPGAPVTDIQETREVAEAIRSFRAWHTRRQSVIIT
jgi:hypothetical protein